MNEAKRILVVGATGNLGRRVVQALRSEGATVRALVRDRAAASAVLAEPSIELVEGSLDSPPEVLEGACEGVATVVSTVQGGPPTIVDGQLKLLRAARERGVDRFIPSDYSFDFFNVRPGANINSDWRRTFAERGHAEAGAVQLVHVLNGCFLDRGVSFGFLGAFDLERGAMVLWGDGEQPMDFTTYDDTARYTAIAATESDVPSRFEVAGDTLNFWQLKRTFEVTSGRTLAVDRRGSLDDLDREIDRRRAEAPQQMFAWLPLMYWRAMLDGSGRLRNPIQDRYPRVRPTTVAAYVADHFAR